MAYAFGVTFTPRCPTCHEAVVWEANPFRPFCSERCRLIDLGAWLSEKHAIPGDAPAPGEDSTSEEPEAR